jgi:hypothetical protein
MTLDLARELAVAGRWDEAGAAVEAEFADDLERTGEWWEALGDELGAVEAYRRAHAAFVVFASWATSGAEGSGRMVDVDRVAAKLDRTRD